MNQKNMEDFALYLGAPDDNRKTVVLPLGATEPQILLKVACSDRARVAVRSEAEALTAVAKSPLAAQVPRFIKIVEANTVVTLHQEYRPRVNCSAMSQELAVVEFLQQLSEIDGRFVPLSEILERLPKRMSASLPAEIEPACLALEGKLHALAESGVSVWLQRVHGDFAPWNCICTRQGLFVYDWEESRTDGMALSDAYYYAVAPVLLMHHNPDPTRTVKAALQFAREVMTGRLIGQDPHLYLALWLLARIHRAPLYGRMMQVLALSWR
jgi:hypothetical protein